MRPLLRERLVLLAILCFAAAVFVAGIEWGLPSRAVDPFLFGASEPWRGEKIIALLPAQGDHRRRGADVDVNPLSDRSRAIVLNGDDAQRAEIIQRYRLQSYQPDEHITFRALSGMRPGELDLDPRLYQYGGLWIYPVGALLKLASVCGWVELRADPAFYLDHPEAFGRFYVVARLYVVAWGVLGAWVVFRIARRASGMLVPAAGAALAYACMPVVINMAHEAKPHLPGAVLILCAVLAASSYVQTGARRWWIAAAVLCGAAAGMVLTAVIICIVLPVMVLLRPDPWRRRATIVAASVLIAGATYFLTNPYVAINLVANREVLRSNFANTAAMYDVGRWREGIVNATFLVREGTSMPLMLAGLVGTAALLARKGDKYILGCTILALAPSAVIFVQLALLGAGKPGEYGRFAVFPGIALALAAICAVGIFGRHTAQRIVVISVLVALTAVPGWFYLRGFLKDASDTPGRLEEAAWLRALGRAGGVTLGVHAEPAPYALPPVDLFGGRLVLLPRGFDIERDSTDADVIIRAVDAPGLNGATAGNFVRASRIGFADAFPTRISWADKPFEVWVRAELLEAVSRGASR